jgi:hypothetical protein
VTGPEVDDFAWDDEVDVICVTAGPAALAAAVAAATAGLDVLLTGCDGPAGAETLVGRLGLVAESADYFAAVTDDADVAGRTDTGLEIRRSGDPLSPDPGPGISFSGAALRDWAATCLASPYGMLGTTVARHDVGAVPVGVLDTGRAVDLTAWLDERAGAAGLPAAAESRLCDLMFVGGEVVGAVLNTPDGQRLVRSTGGVVVPTGTAQLPTLAAGTFEQRGTVELVIIARPFSRLARLELLVTRD